MATKLAKKAISKTQQDIVLTTRIDRYKTDLVGQHNMAELNYVRLLRLLPLLASQDTYIMQLDLEGFEQALKVEFNVTERCRYTTMLSMARDNICTSELENSYKGLLLLPSFAIRIYHDVKLAEVVECDAIKRLRAKYTYPNRQMLMPDEKQQLNRLFGEWLVLLQNQAYSTDLIEFK